MFRLLFRRGWHVEMRADIIIPLFVAGVAIAVWQLSPKLDNVLNPCALGNYTDGVCVCPEPFSGVHCEIIECGYGREITSVWEVDLITTLSEEGAVYGCACENQFWGVNCDQCTSAYPDDCTGVCLTNYYGASCDILCKAGSLQDAQVVVHEGLNGEVLGFMEGSRRRLSF